MLITLFLSLGENSDRYGNGNSQNLAFNCSNTGSHNYLQLVEVTYMKPYIQIDGSMEIMHVSLFLSFDQNYGCYGNRNSPNMAFKINSLSVIKSKCGDNCSVKHNFNISQDAGVTAIARTIQLNNRAKMASTD